MREINLLPPARRKVLRRESLMVSTQDFLTSVTMALVLTTCVGVLLIGVLWALSLAATRTTAGELKEAITEYKSLREDIARQNLFLEEIAALGRKRIVWSDVVREVIAVVPPGVTIEETQASVEFDKKNIKAAKLVIKGRAITRSTLTVFEGRLRALSIVGAVKSPTTNLLERNNPGYQFDIILKLPEEAKAKGK